MNPTRKSSPVSSKWDGAMSAGRRCNGLVAASVWPPSSHAPLPAPALPPAPRCPWTLSLFPEIFPEEADR